MRDVVLLECDPCGNRLYSSTRNKKTQPEKLEAKKFCKICRKHTDHKEKKA